MVSMLCLASCLEALPGDRMRVKYREEEAAQELMDTVFFFSHKPDCKIVKCPSCLVCRFATMILEMYLLVHNAKTTLFANFLHASSVYAS